MEIFIAILLWLGVISTPEQATSDVIRANQELIQKTLNDAEAEKAWGPAIIHILEDPG